MAVKAVHLPVVPPVTDEFERTWQAKRQHNLENISSVGPKLSLKVGAQDAPI